MSLQNQPDINTLLHNMCAQILALTTQLAKMQAQPPAATPSVEKKFNKKVEVVADPGAFEGDRARFAEWWIKLQIWVKANWDAFADDFKVATAVLSRLKGPVAGRYAQVRMQECYTAGVWPTWDNLKVEIEKYFKPQAERDWARQQIRSFKQGNMRTDDFVTRFLALSIQGGLGNEHAVELLEGNVNPHIAEQLYLQDMRSDNLSQAVEEVQKIGRAIELYKMHQGGGSTTKNNYSQRSPGSSNQNQNHSHRFQPYRLQPGRGAPMDINAVQGGQKRRFTCFSCGKEGHMARDGTNRVRATHQKNNQGRQARQSETEKLDNQLQTLTGCSYDKIQAFFYDQQVNEIKAQGKEFGA
ncbi:hypothetical protein SERLA73DRAFT_72167 [Serpula lacrymans var. lacrymans S7.3]|uniref:CCHC-type domain-containing protein n=2 Tax=Serpula lacrymans var. lacrymans TaxID=341189 RepID=F8PRW8_SERL3|nr:uncharacterized protein SERLADRAFT_436676 [Serpula lacrymans var. lacrymans S7.9]EGO01203.1 hypothetical protein SERLA73DRAFT_72167 [Serpula lacrymans var. lacrymans S7.3]EGO26849.1 hypothetical protein SERLADRAFT_436676 [Serpula lacrymans var. lacrymans S7.9]